MSPATRVAAEAFWEYIAFALNSVVFLLIGLEVPIKNLVSSWVPIVAAYLIVTLGRGIVVHIVWWMVSFTRERFSWPWSLVITWGGLRGALPMVLALGLPAGFAFREQIVTTTFGVVTSSMLGHGLSMSPVLRRLGLGREADEQGDYDFLRGELQTSAAALEELERLERLHTVAPELVEQLRTEYKERIDRAPGEIGKLAPELGHYRSQDADQTRRHLLLVEKNRVVDAYRQGILSPAVHDRLLADIDARILELESSTKVDGQT